MFGTRLMVHEALRIRAEKKWDTTNISDATSSECKLYGLTLLSNTIPSFLLSSIVITQADTSLARHKQTGQGYSTRAKLLLN